MFKKILTKFFSRKTLISILKVLLIIYKKSYSIMTTISEVIEGQDKHPKHRIMQYREWFSSNIKPKWTVLDIGSHNGHMTYFLSDYCHFIYGLELSKTNIEIAKKNRSKNNIEYIHADATTYDYQGKNIDCVTLSNVLEHIQDREYFLKKIISQVNWKNEPLFLIRVPMIDRDWMPKFLDELGLDCRLDVTHYTEYTFKSFKDELSSCNIEISSYHIQWGEIYAVCTSE